MGGDFTYQDANYYYKNLDKLIRYDLCVFSFFSLHSVPPLPLHHFTIIDRHLGLSPFLSDGEIL